METLKLQLNKPFDLLRSVSEHNYEKIQLSARKKE